MALSARLGRGARILAGALLILSAAAAPSYAAQARATKARLTAAQPLTLWWGSPPFTQNFNPFAPQPLELTKGTVYEPLYIVSYVANKTYPWLATSYSWSKDFKTLTFTIRSGVKWSDGRPLTAADVYYTLNLKDGAENQVGLWGPNGLATSVSMAGNTVSIHMKKADISTFADIVNNLYIVPQHIWATIKSPLTWTNPNPVGSGPFTQLTSFGVSSYTLGKNPYYWQPLQVDAVRAVTYNTNDAAYADLAAGRIDWAAAFIPNADQLCEAKSPTCHHLFLPKDAPVMLYFNNTKYPYSLPAFRMAVSMAINRQALYNNAEYGYEPPANITGLNGQWSDWMNTSVGNAAATYNLSGAQALLKSAGFTLQNGKLIDPKGHPISFEINVVSGWTDWIAIDQIVSQNLKALGIDATPKVLQYSDYFTRISNGTFDSAVSWACRGGTPYSFYNQEAGGDMYQPIGVAATGCNFERYKNPSLDALLYKFRTTTDVAQQHALVDQMQKIWAADIPAIPLVIGAVWYEYNTMHYTGFVTQSNVYGSGSFVPNDRLLTYIRLRPTGH